MMKTGESKTETIHNERSRKKDRSGNRKKKKGGAKKKAPKGFNALGEPRIIRKNWSKVLATKKEQKRLR